ncbi:MAG: FeoB-associated Cys-rich membrane protein [Fimbriiglobus sp.]
MWQSVAVVVILTLAVSYILRATWKTWTHQKSGCGNGCNKCPTPAPTPTPADRHRISLPQV